MRYWIRSLAVIGLLVSSLRAEDTLVWPQFRGAAGAGINEGQSPPVEFGPEKNVFWKVSVPSGSSSPIVIGDLLVFTAFEDGKLYTLAYQRESGKEIWRREAPAETIEAFHATEGSPAASTPVTDGQRIVSYFGSCGLLCYDLAGRELWQVKLPVARTAFDFGTGVSPIIAEGVVVLVRDERSNPRIMAFAAASGELLWESKRQSISSHSTPVIWETTAGKVVVAPGVGRMIGYDLKTGEEKWWVNGMPSMCCASPVIGNDTLYLAAWSPGEDVQLPSFDDLLQLAQEVEQGEVSKTGLDRTFMKGFFENQDFDHNGRITRQEWDEARNHLAQSRNSALSLRSGGIGDITESHVRWRTSKAKGLPYVPSVILYRGQCVTVKDGGIVTAYDAESGKELYMRRLGTAEKYYASPVAANGSIYLISLETGLVTVIRGGAVTPEVIAKNALNDRIAATPAIADDTLYIRTANHLYAFRHAQ